MREPGAGHDSREIRVRNPEERIKNRAIPITRPIGSSKPTTGTDRESVASRWCNPDCRDSTQARASALVSRNEGSDSPGSLAAPWAGFRADCHGAPSSRVAGPEAGTAPTSASLWGIGRPLAIAVQARARPVCRSRLLEPGSRTLVVVSSLVGRARAYPLGLTARGVTRREAPTARPQRTRRQAEPVGTGTPGRACASGDLASAGA